MTQHDPTIAAFVEDIIAVYRKHGMALERDDHGTGYFIVDYKEGAVEDLRQAEDRLERGRAA